MASVGYSKNHANLYVSYESQKAIILGEYRWTGRPRAEGHRRTGGITRVLQGYGRASMLVLMLLKETATFPRRSYWIPGTYALALSEKHNLFKAIEK